MAPLNLREVQSKNGIGMSPAVSKDFALEIEGVGNDSWEYPSFTVEVETGTSKLPAWTYRLIRENTRSWWQPVHSIDEQLKLTSEEHT